MIPETEKNTILPAPIFREGDLASKVSKFR